MAVEVSVREICGELEITALEPGSGSISFQTPEISRPRSFLYLRLPGLL